MVGKCTMCNAIGVPLTTHHVWEAPFKDDKVQTLDICDECHQKHNLYQNALRDNGIVTDRRKLDS